MADAENRPAGPEQEPLLGQPGDASLPEGKPLYHNLTLGTAPLAQAGILILAALVWAGVFSHQLLPLVSPHPLLNSAALVLLAQGILILQPTHTAAQKKSGTYTHAALNDVAFLAFAAAAIVIIYNKFDHNGKHFESPHAILGLVFYILLVVQALVGFTQYFVPQLYGGVDNAKSVYKYHRWSGYVLFTLGLVVVAAATKTDYNVNVLGVQTWTVVVAAVVTLLGLLPRIKKVKLGL